MSRSRPIEEIVSLRSSCPINYDYDKCSSKDYGQTCETCINYDEAKINEIKLRIS